MSVLMLKNGYKQRMLTKAIADKIPAIGAQAESKDPIAYVKYFVAGWTWFVTELDPETGEMFGKVYSPMCPDGELGYIDLNELATTKVCGMFSIERDQYFEPKPLSECKDPCGG